MFQNPIGQKSLELAGLEKREVSLPSLEAGFFCAAKPGRDCLTAWDQFVSGVSRHAFQSCRPPMRSPVPTAV